MNLRRRAVRAGLGLLVAAAVADPAPAGGVGAALFEGGPEAASVEVRVGTGRGLPAPASRFACRSCHGRDGRGGSEGGSPVPSIEPGALAVPTSRRPAYGADAFASTLRDGTDPAGRLLAPLMPRYGVSDEQAAELFSFLRAVAVRERAGVTTASVRFGVPATVPPELAVAFHRAWLERGEPRIHGRRVVVEPVDSAEGENVFASLFAPVRSREGPNGGLPRDAIRGEASGPPVLFPAAPLQGGEDPGLVRGLFASRAAQAAALLRDAPESAVLAADSDGLPLLEGAGATSSGERPVHAIDGTPRSDTATAFVVMANPAEWQRLAAHRRFRPGTTLYGCLDDAAGAAAELRRQGLRLVLADPRPVRAAGPLRPARDRFAAAAAAVLEAALSAAGRDLTRGQMLRALSALAVEPPGWPALDYGRFPLTGSGDVGLIRLAPLP